MEATLLKLGLPGLGAEATRGKGEPPATGNQLQAAQAAVRSRSHSALELQNRPSGRPSCPEQGLPSSLCRGSDSW